MEPKIIFKDDVLLILDKPSGWIVNEAITTKRKPVIQTWLYKNFDYPIVKNSQLRGGIVHRLDKETSGVLVVAKTGYSFKYLQLQFKKRTIKKKYMALAHGNVEPSHGIIKAPVGRLPWNRERFGVLPGGRDAETKYKTISGFSNPNEMFTLIALYPKTGRTHQIRIHLRHIGNPVVSDEFYAGRKTARNDRKWCPRLFLHASKIYLKHPKTKKSVSFESKIPQDLKKSLASLEKTEKTT